MNMEQILGDFLQSKNNNKGLLKTIVYDEFFDANEAMDFIDFLQKNNFPYHAFRPTKNIGDSVILGYQIPQPIVVIKVLETELEKIDELREQYIMSSINEAVIDEHVFNQFTNDELMNVLSESEKWHFMDWVIAKRLLEKRNVSITENDVITWQNNYKEKLYKPKTIKPLLLFFTGITCILFPLLGSTLTLAFALPFPFFLWQSKTKIGSHRLFTYDENTRKWGAIIFFLSLFVFLIYFFIYKDLSSNISYDLGSF